MIEKEFRALLPIWLAAAAAMLLAHASGRAYEFLGAAAFWLGAATLGAFSIGHEYVYRTVGLVLTLPIPRSRLWASKLVVLAAFVTSLAVLAFYVQAFGNATAGPLRVLTLAVVAAVGLAPWVAMLSRSALGGAVFAASIPGFLFTAAQFTGLQLYGYTRTVDEFTETFMTVAMVSLSALGVVLGWRRFERLEAIEGRGADVSLFRSSGPTSAFSARRRSHPIWLLVMKEARLQQIPWVLTAIYVAIYVSIVQFSSDRGNVDNLVTLLTVFYTVIIGLLVGALAGGEERQLGVHDAQLLLPISSLLQWMVKIASSLALGVVLTIVLPLILVTVLPPEAIHKFGRRGLISSSTIMLLPTLVTLGLYVSVVAGSGVRGLIASIPVGMAMFYLFIRFIQPLAGRIARSARTETTDQLIYYEPLLPRNSEPYVFALAFGLFLVVVLRLALTNYRWSDQSPLRLARHAAIALTALTACFVLLAALGIR